MSNLLSLKFWLASRPGALLPVYHNALIAFIVFLTIAALVFSFLGRTKGGAYNKIWRGLSGFSLSNIIIGLLLLFFTYEMIPVLSSRFWFIVWGAEMAIWLFFIARAAQEIPKRKKRAEEEKQFKKYLP